MPPLTDEFRLEAALGPEVVFHGNVSHLLRNECLALRKEVASLRPKPKGPRPDPDMVYVRWFDSCITHGIPVGPDYDFGPVENETCGLLVKEDDEKIIIALDRCIDTDNVRCTLSIPKVNVRTITRLRIHPDEKPTDPKKTPYLVLSELFRADLDYAWVWHCNIAMAIQDHMGVAHGAANRMAAVLMMRMFHVDTTKCEEFAAIQEMPSQIFREWIRDPGLAYVVMPRSLVQAMPFDWQRHFVRLLDQYNAELDDHLVNGYGVTCRDEFGNEMIDPHGDYQNPTVPHAVE